MKQRGYLTRALKANDPRFARILGKMGYATAVVAPAVSETPVAQPAPTVEPVTVDAAASTTATVDASKDDDLEALRAAYKAKTGEDADKRWGAARLVREVGGEG